MLLEHFDPTVQVVGHVGEVLGALEKGCFVLVAKT
jgi:Icc-related predicted phosphoesterase